MSTTTQAQHKPRTKKPRTFDFYEDPGHGWLRVPCGLLRTLGIEQKISTYSYMRGDWAYLEEDCDYSTFAVAMRDAGHGAFKVREHHTNKRSKVRGYDTFRAVGHMQKTQS